MGLVAAGNATMNAGGAPSSTETTLIVLAIIVLVLVRRIFATVRGAPVSPARLFGFAGLYTVLFAVTVGLGAAGAPWYLFAGLAAIVVVASVLSASWVRGHVVLEQRPPAQQWYYRLHPWILVAYVLLFLVRLAVSLEVLGANAFTFGAPVTGLTTTSILLLDTVDLLFAASTGLLLGRSVGVYLAYRAKLAERPTAPPAPPATAPLPSGGR